VSDYPPKNLGVVKERFLFTVPVPNFFDPFDIWMTRKGVIGDIVRAFRSNLQSAVSVGSVPSKLTNSAVMEAEYRRIYVAEAIRGGKENDEANRRLVADVARHRFGKLQKEAEFQRRLITSVVDSLFYALDDTEFATAADELLRQAAVMVWGAFEVVATDIAIEVLNRKPSLATRLYVGELAKRMGGLRGIPLETLGEYGFDVSGSMGTILLGDKRLDSLPAIAMVCEALYGSTELDKKLKTPALHILNQRRHLIVHRRGIVDALYLSKTPDNALLGSVLRIVTADVDIYLKESMDTGLEIARSAAELLV
jgi:hypothetical protein